MLNKNTLICIIDIGNPLKKKDRNHEWHASFARKANEKWNGKRQEYLDGIHSNIIRFSEKAKQCGAKVYNCNYTGWPISESFKKINFDGTANSSIPSNIKNIYLIGGSFDQCIMHRPKGYMKLSKKYTTNVILDCCFQSRKVVPIDFVIKRKQFKRTQESFSSKQEVEKYQLQFCKINKVNHKILSDFGMISSFESKLSTEKGE